MEAIKTTVVGAVGGGRRSEVGGVWSEEVKVSAAGAAGGRGRPPW